MQGGAARGAEILDVLGFQLTVPIFLNHLNAIMLTTITAYRDVVIC